MIKNILLKKSAIPALTKGLDVYALRQKVSAANIANIQNPDYRRKEVKFEDSLQSALNSNFKGMQTNSKHIAIGTESIQESSPTVIEDSTPTLDSGINNVNIDQEIVEQVKNEIRFLYGTRMISKNFASLRASIKGRFDQ